MYAHLCIYYICVYFTAVYSAVRIPLMSNCNIWIRIIIVIIIFIIILFIYYCCCYYYYLCLCIRALLYFSYLVLLPKSPCTFSNCITEVTVWSGWPVSGLTLQHQVLCRVTVWSGWQSQGWPYNTRRLAGSLCGQADSPRADPTTPGAWQGHFVVRLTVPGLTLQHQAPGRVTLWSGWQSQDWPYNTRRLAGSLCGQADSPSADPTTPGAVQGHCVVRLTVPVLTLQHQAPGRAATRASVLKSGLWLDQGRDPRSAALEADALTTKPWKWSLPVERARSACCCRYFVH